MRWLITVRKTVDLDRLTELIRGSGGDRDQSDEPIPLGESDLVIHATGPAELPKLLEDDADVIDVYPDSEMHPY